MHVKKLVLKGFRSYCFEEFTFKPGINLILGRNGIGKTNLLEALHLFFSGRSFRCSLFKELISHNDTSFTLEVSVQIDAMEHSLSFSFDGEKRKLLHNKTNLSSLSAWLGLIQGVTLSPEDKLLIKGSPQQRRVFLDTHLIQIDPLYFHHLSRYHHGMKQRNLLLKTHQTLGLDEIENLIALSATYIDQRREQFIGELSKKANEVYQKFEFSHETLNLNYARSAKNPYSILFKNNRGIDSKYGVTTEGIHRDDLEVFKNHKLARFTASEGQIRCIVIALKLALWELMEKEHLPLLCIDDLDLSLDHQRRELLYASLPKEAQVIITSADLNLKNKEGHLIVLCGE